MTTQEEEEEERMDQSFPFDRLGGKYQRLYLEGKQISPLANSNILIDLKKMHYS